ncbi:MAG TPA: MFS transporter [Chloroflexota bacterium]|nr:MFS transporter [Chloroflexota bacterium]
MLSKVTARFGVHYGWLVVVVIFLVLLTIAAIRSLPGLVIKPLEDEFHWSRSGISFAIAVSILMSGLGGPFSGKLISRFGPMRLLVGALVVSALATGALIWLQTIVQLTVIWGIVVGLMSGVLGIPLGAALASRWFVERRGLVTGILGAGSSAGALIWVPIFMDVTVNAGWRAAMLLGAVLLLLLIPLVLLVVRDSPLSVGLSAYGSERAPANDAVDAQRTTSMAEALRTRDWWLLAGSFFVCGYTSNGLIGTHLIPHAVEHGFTENVAAGALALIGAFNVVGTIGSGYLTDRFNPRRLLAMYYAFRAASLVLLPSVTTETGLIAFSVLFGLDYIATVPPTVALTAERFGRASLATVFGWITFSHMVGGALASYASGVARDLFGDYTLAFIVAAIFGFIAAALSLQVSSGARRVEPAPAAA